jgi:NAD(P)-dependent dehydrogenase (short-subunit alcohol dehydrogenase family)
VIAASSPNYHVVISSRSLEKGQKALADIQQRSPKGSLSLVQLDVTDEDSISNAASTIAKDFGRLDVLINNAGIASNAGSLNEQLQQTFATNTIGPALVTEDFLPLLQKSSNGRLIYVTSSLGSMALRVDPSSPSYTNTYLSYRMSKAALNMLMACNYVDYGKMGIKVFSVCPGYVVTSLTGENDRENRIKRGAGSPAVSAETILSVVDGRRDADNGRIVHKDGTYPW